MHRRILAIALTASLAAACASERPRLVEGASEGGGTGPTPAAPAPRSEARPAPARTPAEAREASADATPAPQIPRRGRAASGAQSAPERLIAFGSGLGDEGGLYVVREDGSGLTEISRDLVQADSPSWSPDGRRIAFWGYTEGSGGAIHTVAPDGSGLHRLAAGGSVPDWSPDGGSVAFARDHGVQRSMDIVRIGSDGSDERVLTSSPVSERSPRWSPDGTRIAYVAGSSIRTMGSDGANSRRVSPLEVTGVSAPRWSPDGTRIAFLARSAGDLTQDYLWVVGSDGSDPRRLREAIRSMGTAEVSWCPDAEWIAFVSRSSAALSLIRPDGSGFRSVTERAAQDDTIHSDPVWSPTGEALVFIRWGGGEGSQHAGVWAIRPDGSDLRRLAGGLPMVRTPAWQPS